jgi:hypothetical protein
MKWFQELINKLLALSETEKNSLLSLFTLLALFWTAIETARSRRSNNDVIKLNSLPILILKIKRKGDYCFFLKNLNNSPAYDIKIDTWDCYIMDVQRLWTVKLKPENLNIVEGKKKIELKALTYEDNTLLLPDRGGELVLASYLRSGIGLYIRFKNCTNQEYISKLLTSYDTETDKIITNILNPPKKFNLFRKILFYCHIFNAYCKGRYYKILWKFDKPHFGSSKEKYNLTSVTTKWIKNKYYQKLFPIQK